MSIGPLGAKEIPLRKLKWEFRDKGFKKLVNYALTFIEINPGLHPNFATCLLSLTGQLIQLL